MRELARFMLALTGTVMSFIGLSTTSRDESKKAWSVILVVEIIIVFIYYIKFF